MKIIDFTVMGFKNLWRRKLRTILTAVGVAIGTISIVVMLSLGIAMSEGYKNQLAEWGSLTKITVEKYGYYYDEESGMGMSNEQKLDDELVNKISAIEHVRGVTPILNVQARLKAGKYESYCSITGIDPDTLEYFDFPEVESGELISNNNPTALLFGKSSCYFYNPRGGGGWRGSYNEPQVDLMNDKIRITFDGVNGGDWEKTPKYDKLNVAGVFVENNKEMNYSVYAPISQVEKWYKEYIPDAKKKGVTYESIWISVDDVKNVKSVQDQIKALGFMTYSMADSLDSVQETSNMLQLILGGIGAVSLLVSAIGIANTMVMSIYERTKEIGVMKVLGCIVTDIRLLFLFEASIIGLIGGMLGLGCSYGISYVLNEYAPQIGEQIGFPAGQAISIIPIWLSMAALIFAILVGVISGLYPAKKATEIRAIEAMKTGN